MTGPLEPTNEAYATAKLAGLQLCQAYRRQYGDRFIAAIPANAFGPHDDFSPEERPRHPRPDPAGCTRPSVAASRTLVVWGTGTPRREFIFRRRPGRRLPVRHAPLRRTRRRSTSAAARPVDRRGGPSRRRGGRLPRPAACSTPASPTACRCKALDSTPLLALGWRPARRFPDGPGRDVRLVSATRRSQEDRRPCIERLYQVAVPHPPRRRRNRPGLSDRQDQEPRPPVDRPGGGVGRRLRGAAARTTSSSAPTAATPSTWPRAAT